MAAAATVLAPLRPVSAAPKNADVTLVTYDSFATSKNIFDAFTKRTGFRVKVLFGGDGGELVNKAILTKDKPLGDVLWGVDNTFLSRAVRERIFTPYAAKGLGDIEPRYRALVPSLAATPVDFGDVCVNFDRAALARRKLAAPVTLDDLIAPRYKGLLVVMNPATSSPGLAFMLATIARYGESAQTGWRSYWTKLKANGVKVVNGWSEAYNAEFSAGGNAGTRPLVVSYGSSPPASVIYGPNPNATTAPIGVAVGTCFRQVEFAGVLARAKNPEGARALIDFLISQQFQEDMPLNMFVFPVNRRATLPKAFAAFAVVPEKSFALSPARIADSRDRWIDEWTSIVL